MLGSVARHAPPRPDGAARRRSSGRGWLGSLLSLLTAVTVLLLPFNRGGLWDPLELRVAEMGRRLAATALGARFALLPEDSQRMPNLSELGWGELPFWSAALGFRWFGLHDWAGRLASVFWGLVAVLSLGLLVGRLADRFARGLSMILLTTLPVFAFQSRMMLGDAATIGCLCLATTGVALACFDERSEKRHGWLPGRTALYWLLGAIGMSLGILCRGVMIAVAVPCLGVGLAVLGGPGPKGQPQAARRHAVGLILLGVAAMVGGLLVLTQGHGPRSGFSYWIGTVLDLQKPVLTFDVVLGQLGYALFPLSAYLPWAAGQILVSASTPGRLSAGERGLGLTLVGTLGAALSLQTILAPWVGTFPFVAPFAAAGLAAVALSQSRRAASVATVPILGTVAVLTLLLGDFINLPDRALVAAASGADTAPLASSQLGLGWIKSAFAVLLVGAVAAGAESGVNDRFRFRKEEYLGWAQRVRTAQDGNVAFLLILLETALVTLAGLVWAAEHGVSMPRLQQLPRQIRSLILVAWALLPAAVLLLPLGVLTLRDLSRLLFDRVIPVLWPQPCGSVSSPCGGIAAASRAERRVGVASRVLVLTVSLVLSGLCMSLGNGPALSEGLSPKQAFLAYARIARPGEPVAILGLRANTAHYYIGMSPPVFEEASSAIDWMIGGRTRRFMIMDVDYLPSANAAFRARGERARNLPVLEIPSARVLLLASDLPAGTSNRNPLLDVVPDHAPSPGHRLTARLGASLQVLGWDVAKPDGSPAEPLHPGNGYELRLYYRVLDAIGLDWKTFVHVEGQGRRINLDHDTLADRYPMSHWQAGDYVVDRHPFRLESGTAPGGYHLYFGLFRGERRMDVTRGPEQDDRVVGGALMVR